MASLALVASLLSCSYAERQLEGMQRQKIRRAKLSERFRTKMANAFPLLKQYGCEGEGAEMIYVLGALAELTLPASLNEGDELFEGEVYRLSSIRGRMVVIRSQPYMTDRLKEEFNSLYEQCYQQVIDLQFTLSNNGVRFVPGRVQVRPETAHIWVDGTDLGLATRLPEFAVGKHTVAIREDGYEEWQQPLTVVEGSIPIEIVANLKKITANGRK